MKPSHRVTVVTIVNSGSLATALELSTAILCLKLVELLSPFACTRVRNMIVSPLGHASHVMDVSAVVSVVDSVPFSHIPVRCCLGKDLLWLTDSPDPVVA